MFRTAHLGALALALAVLAGCVSPPPIQAPPRAAAEVPAVEPKQPSALELKLPPQSAPGAVAGAYDGLAAWKSAQLAPGREALGRSCNALGNRPAAEPLSDNAPWAGRVGDWRALCASLEAFDGGNESTRRAFESLTVPVEITDTWGASRLTGYFEPMIEARRSPEPGFTAPVPGLPPDLVQTGSGPMKRGPGGRLSAYPPRAEIEPDLALALGYAHPADVFFLQIQGSGRLRFPDGATVRASYAAHNGHPFKSTANWLIERGKIQRGEASMQGIRAWMDRVSAAEAREAMEANPRYVFFRVRPEGDASLGPVGAANIPLTALGSMAVDPAFHPLGVPYLVETNAPGLGGEWRGILVSQDTGGAIQGPVRGDIYFGSGNQAGDRAGTMNAPGRFWALLPRAAAKRLYRAAAEGASAPGHVQLAQLP
ncbi:MAG: MltA domain-containing protein [Pseudomonadota bacterium]